MSQVKSKTRKSTITSTAQKNSISTDAVFMQLDVRQFCPKRIYDIVFIQPVDTESDTILKSVVETAREYEDISGLTFITYEEVMDLVHNYTEEVFPLSLNHIPETVCKAAAEIINNGEPLHSSLQAELVKLKLIQVMHRQYLKELEKVDRRKALEDELNSLTKEMKKGKKDKGVPNAKSEVSSKIKEKDSKYKLEITKTDDLAYTTTSENDIIFDDDIFNHVWYYIIQGVTDSDIILYLNQKYHVTVSAVLKFGMDTIQTSGRPYEVFWEKLRIFFYGRFREESFENTILMKHSTSETEGKAILEEIVYVVKKISDLKLNHLNYIRHIKMDEQKHTYKLLPIHCFQRYNEMLKRVPFELVSEPIILSCMLDEVQYQHEKNLLEDNSVEDLLKPHVDIEISCRNPCDTREVFKGHSTIPSIEMPKQLFKPFYSYEGDIVDIIANTYKKRGSVVVQLLDSILKKTEPMRLVTNYKNDCRDIPHRHDVDPASKLSLKLPETHIHFMYLLLFSLFKYDQAESSFVGTELTEVLQTFNKYQFWETSQIEIIEDTEPRELPNCEVNFFEPIYMDYIWRERLPSSCLLKAVYDAMNDFTYMEKTFCEETDTLLVLFTDHLDRFGVNVNVYQVHIKTPVCFRDFCRYVTVEEAKWLERNKPLRYVRPAEEHEICEGKKAIIKKDIFKEYRYLLDTNIQLESEPEEIEIEKKPSVSFQETLEELQGYPTNKGIVEQCNKADPQFLAYPMGTQHFRLRGTRTTFASHDGLKVVVDNTSILTEDPKCTVTLSCRDNQLVLHSNNIYTKNDHNYTFHWNLNDGTIVMFILRPPKAKRKSVMSESVQVRLTSDEPEGINGISEERKSSDINSAASDQKESFSAEHRNSTDSLKIKQIPKIFAVDEDWFANMTNEEDDVALQTVEPEKVVSELQIALENGRQVYKVNNKLSYLKRKFPKTEIPITSLLNRVLHKRIKRVYGNEIFVRRYDFPNTEEKYLEVNSKLDFRITLPNGLYITCYPSQLRESICEVKQEYLEKGVDQSGIMSEEFRIFTREGFVLIKKVDGSITILKSNGDTVKYDKPDSQNEDVIKSNLRRCHCKTVTDYRKKLTRIMKDQNRGECYVSRRAYMRSKKGYVISDDAVSMLRNSEIPYLKSSSIKFSGKYTCLQKNKIIEKQLYYTTQQQDLFTEEVFYERTDGFQGMFDRTGKLQVKYADKTKITSSVYESKELYDGYVYVSMCFEFEHPHYATVSYNENNDVEIRLNNDVVLTKHPTDNICLSIGEDVATEMDPENVKVCKRCPKCLAESNAHFDISPFFARKLNFLDEFLRVEDSYNKIFYSNFAGNCKRNSNFIDGPFNCEKCNHYLENAYEKMFVVNRNYTGDYLWSQNMVNQKDLARHSSRVADLLDMEDGRDRRMKYENKHYDSLDRRFLNNRLLEEQFCLTKYKEQTEQKNISVCYSTVTILQQILDPMEVNRFLNDVMKDFKGCALASLGDVAKNALTQMDQMKLFQEPPKEIIIEEDPLCKCLTNKRTMKQKSEDWRKEYTKYKTLIRNKDIPKYFSSQFCKTYQKA